MGSSFGRSGALFRGGADRKIKNKNKNKITIKIKIKIKNKIKVKGSGQECPLYTGFQKMNFRPSWIWRGAKAAVGLRKLCVGCW